MAQPRPGDEETRIDYQQLIEELASEVDSGPALRDVRQADIAQLFKKQKRKSGNGGPPPDDAPRDEPR